MKSRWIIAGAAALALALLTLPIIQGSRGVERVSPSSGSTPATTGASAAAGGETCDGTGSAKLDFVVKDMNGAQVKLADYKGKVILLNFWATWCGPCEMEIPAFVDLYKEYKDRGLMIVGVSLDDSPAALRAYAQSHHMQYPIVQMQSDVEDAYGPIIGVPITYFIARDGSICTRHLGPATREQFERAIKALL